MPTFSIIRFASVALVIIVASLIPDKLTYKLVVVSATFVHYALAYWYSQRQIKGVFSQASSIIGLGVLLAITYACYKGEASLLSFIFSFHLVFNEVYLLHRGPFKPLFARTNALRVSSIVFNVLLYLLAVRVMMAWLFPILKPVILATVVAGAVWLWQFMKVRAMLPAKGWFDACGLEVMGLIAVALSFFAPINIFDVVFYHITFWGFVPLLKMQTLPTKRPMFMYIAQNVVGVIVALQLTPLGINPFHFVPAQIMDQFRLWSFIHIFTSCSLSNAHPAWVVGLFQPKYAFDALTAAPPSASPKAPQVPAASVVSR